MTDRHHGITHSANTPYFAYVSLNAPHAPYIAPDEYKKRFLDAGYDEKTAGRYGMIENIDDNVGRLMSKLNEWGALDNTLIIFMTDNGMSMPAMIKEGKKIIPYNAGLKGRKNSPYEGGTYVPMYWQWKGVLDSNIDIDKLTAHIDLYPTLSELAGAKSPKTMQQLDGRSLLPLLHHSNPVWDDCMLRPEPITHFGIIRS